jgi:hypothetical protein
LVDVEMPFAEDVLPLSEPALDGVLVVVASSEGPFSFEAIMPSKLLTKFDEMGGEWRGVQSEAPHSFFLRVLAVFHRTVAFDRLRLMAIGASAVAYSGQILGHTLLDAARNCSPRRQHLSRLMFQGLRGHRWRLRT